MINFHVHSEYCHGKCNPEAYIKSGIINGIESIGFSSHAPLPFKKDWTMNTKDIIDYCNCIKSLKIKYENDINVFLGLEVDFISGYKRNENFRALGVDYIIGSNHFIGKDSNGELKRIESSKAGVIISDNVKYYVENYFRLISEMVIYDKPDIVGHFDIIKKVNLIKQYFDEKEDWYQNIVNDTLRVIKDSNTIVEVNTCNLSKESSKWLYPSLDILRNCYIHEIPITLGSDAHKPEDITSGYNEVFDLLKDIGFKSLMSLTQNGWMRKNI